MSDEFKPTIRRSEQYRGVMHDPGPYEPMDMYSEFEALLEAKILNAQLVSSEVTRIVKDYLLLNIEAADGSEIRLIFMAAEVKKPAPNDNVMWDTDGFFTLKDMRARRRGKPFELAKWIED